MSLSVWDDVWTFKVEKKFHPFSNNKKVHLHWHMLQLQEFLQPTYVFQGRFRDCFICHVLLQSIMYGLTVVQMKNWSLNRQFYIFDTYFAKF